MSEIVMVFYLAGDKDICTVAGWQAALRKRRRLPHNATVCISARGVCYVRPYFEGFLYPFQEFKFCFRYFQFAMTLIRPGHEFCKG